jgi:transcriptional regulator with XRE-family HTH domain
MPQGSRHKSQREPKDPPYVPIKYVRLAAGLSLEDVSAKIKEATGREYGKGTLSAIESGMRGASSEVLDALEQAYQLPVGSIKTEYVPRAPRRKRQQNGNPVEIL